MLIPALILAEEDRLQGELEEGTARFIQQTVRELIDEFGFKEGGEADRPPAAGGNGDFPPGGERVRPMRVMCVPVRNEADELVAMMLAQCLQGNRVHAFAVPVRRMNEMMNAVTVEGPDVVFLSGLPPFGMGRAHRLYRSLRARNPQLKVMIGIWNFPENANAVAQETGRGEDVAVLTRFTEAVAEVRAMARGDSALETVGDRSAA